MWTKKEIEQLVQELYNNYYGELNHAPTSSQLEYYIKTRTTLPKNPNEVWTKWSVSKSLQYFKWWMSNRKELRYITSLEQYLSLFAYPGLPTPIREEVLLWNSFFLN